MYQALYRKYRPKTFEDVVGQDVIVKTLQNSILHNRINHAYLFTGPRGCGKTTIAKILAKTVNCQNLDGTKICNKCVCCTQNNNENLDIIEIDAASNNGVDEIRDINSKVNLAPSFGKYKIYIIDEVHMLTIGAFNALLKTLEEPPRHVIFILATTDPQKVPVTILSRCQRYDFKKISINNIHDRLKFICEQECIEIESEALDEIAYLGDGCLRDALSILDQVIAYADNKITIQDIHDVNGTLSNYEIQELINETCSKKLNEVLIKINNYNNNGKSMIKITEEIILYFRNLLLFKLNSKIEQPELYEKLKNKVNNQEILENIEILNQTLLDMKKFSNPKLLLELAFIKIMNLNQNISEINSNQNPTEVNLKNRTVEMPIKPKEEEKELSKNSISPDNESKTSVEGSREIKQENISREIVFDDKIVQELADYVKIRINNALSRFLKKDTMELKPQLQLATEYLLDENYSNVASMLLDGNLKAASDEYVVFTYQTPHLSYKFNENIPKIEQLLEKILNKKYKVIATDDDNWEEIKIKFNKKQEKFEYQEETINIDDILKKINKTTDDSLKLLFGDIVEYK